MLEASIESVDTVMRVAHNLRKETAFRALSAAECAVMAADLRLHDAGWRWGPDGPTRPAGQELRRLYRVWNPLESGSYWSNWSEISEEDYLRLSAEPDANRYEFAMVTKPAGRLE